MVFQIGDVRGWMKVSHPKSMPGLFGLPWWTSGEMWDGDRLCDTAIILSWYHYVSGGPMQYDYVLSYLDLRSCQAHSNPWEIAVKRISCPRPTSLADSR
jgi:hypothetical protein